MQSKKIIAILMSLSIIGSTSLLLGGVAKAETPSSTSSYVSNEVLPTQQEVMYHDLHLNLTSNGVVTWEKMQSKFAKSRYYLMSEGDGSYPIFVLTTTKVVSGNISASIPDSIIASGAGSISPGIYKFTAINYDSNDVAYVEQSITLIYDGNTYSTIGVNLTLSKDGTVKWDSIDNVDFYRCYVHTELYNKYEPTASEAISKTNTSTNIKSFATLTPGIYYVTLDAFDANNNILASQTLEFYYVSDSFIVMNNKLLNK